MTHTPWNDLDHLARHLSDCGAVATELVNHLTLPQLKAIAVIFEHHPVGIKLKEVAEALHLTPGAVSQTVDALVRAEVLERTPAPDDRRAVLVRPAPHGLELLATRDANVSKVFDRIAADVEPTELATFIKVLKTLRGNIDALTAAEPELFS